MKLKHYTARCLTLAAVFAAAVSAQATYAQYPAKSDTIDLGYFRQSVNSITGAISVVSGQELEKSPVADISQTFAGRFSGLFTSEMDGELSKSLVMSYVRGLSSMNGQEPIYILDGVICSLESINYITPQEIESVSVLKDASLTAIYGIEGGHGAIVINTKRGTKDRFRVGVTFDQSFQQMTRQPRRIDSWDYARLRNEAWRNDGALGDAPFSESQIAGYKAGNDPLLYPNTDYYEGMFRPWAMMQRAGISTSTGGDKIKMFSNINFMHQGGQFIHDQATFKPGEKKYDPKAGESYRINYRTNLDFRINKFIDGFIRLNGNITKERLAGNLYGQLAGESSKSIYSGLFQLPPTLYGPYTPMATDPNDPNKVTGGEVLTTDQVDNPAYGMLNRFGYGNYTGTNIMAQTGLNVDLGFLTKGLSVGGRFSYETNSSGYHHIGAQYERWVRDNDPDQAGFVRIGEGTWDNKPLDHEAKTTGYKLALFSYRLNANAQINYQRTFGKNSVAAMVYGYYQNYISERTDGVYGFPYNRVSTGATVSWNYDDRYFVKADAAYSGSDQFAKGKRFIVTPSVSAGWIVTNERFLSGLKNLNYLKLRASVGITGNDRIGSGRFLYSDNYINGGNLYVGSFGYVITEYMMGNPNLTAEKIMKQNYGLDLTVFRSLSLSVDYFRSRTTNMIINEEGRIPSFTGITADIIAPVNGGEMKNNGFEVTLGYNKAVNKNLALFASANFTYAKNELVNVGETTLGSGYAYQYRQQGYSVGQPFGYLVDKANGSGYFTSQEELNKVHYTFGTPRLGDFIYRNLNGDKTADGRDIIDEKDLAPIGNPSLPRMSYGITLGLQYRSFGFSCLIQGTGYSSGYFQDVMGMDESLYGGVYSDIHMHAWTPERFAAGENITFPALSQQHSTSRQPNDFFIMNTSYVRIKNLEVSYTLPKTVVRFIHAQELKIVASAQNLFTWDFLKTDCIDPEIGKLDAYQNYRVFNIGLKLTF